MEIFHTKPSFFSFRYKLSPLSSDTSSYHLPLVRGIFSFYIKIFNSGFRKEIHRHVINGGIGKICINEGNPASYREYTTFPGLKSFIYLFFQHISVKDMKPFIYIPHLYIYLYI